MKIKYYKLSVLLITVAILIMFIVNIYLDQSPVYIKYLACNPIFSREPGYSALHKAAYLGDNKKVLKLLKNGADINEVAAVSGTPLYLAVIQGNVNTVKLLLAKGARVNDDIRNDVCTPTLDCALKTRHLHIAELLLAQGTNINMKSKWHEPLLIRYTGSSDLNITKWLIEHDADVNISDKYGQTPLFYSIQNCNTVIAHNLIINGADIDINDVNGRSPLYYAQRNNCSNIVKMIEDKAKKR
ncbi:MAG: ankyrin repeat domain-containing protein [bacterium]